MTLLMGGKKGNTKKYFKAWVIGLAVVKKERLTTERKAAWLKGCGCHESHTGPCGIERVLRDPTCEIPFDLQGLQRTLGSLAGYGSDAMWRSQSMPLFASRGRRNSMTRH